MELYYLNCKNQKIDFTIAPYLINDISELLNYSWDYEQSASGKINGFTRGICELTLTINILVDTREEFVSACNRFMEIAELDISSNKRGKLYYDGQYIWCNLINSQSKDWFLGIDFNLKTFSLVTDTPFWTTENEYTFLKSGTTEKSVNLEYPYKYPHDYLGDIKGLRYLYNDHYSSCNYKLLIYGPCLNPRIMIGSQLYEVKTNIDDGEYLSITSDTRKIVRVKLSGEEVNEFDNRTRENSVFEKIPTGNQVVSWDGNFGFDLVLYQERSEPKWI